LRCVGASALRCCPHVGAACVAHHCTLRRKRLLPLARLGSAPLPATSPTPPCSVGLHNARCLAGTCCKAHTHMHTASHSKLYLCVRDAAGAQQALLPTCEALQRTHPLPRSPLAQAACEGALSTHAPEGITFKCAALGTPDECAAAISMGAQDFSVFGGEWVVGWWGWAPPPAGSLPAGVSGWAASQVAGVRAAASAWGVEFLRPWGWLSPGRPWARELKQGTVCTLLPASCPLHPHLRAGSDVYFAHWQHNLYTVSWCHATPWLRVQHLLCAPGPLLLLQALPLPDGCCLTASCPVSSACHALPKPGLSAVCVSCSSSVGLCCS